MMRRGLTPQAAVDILGLGDRGDLLATQLAAWAIATLTSYSLSDAAKMADQHAPNGIAKVFTEDVLGVATALWKYLTDKRHKDRAVPYSVGLKMWNLSDGPALPRQYEAILLDDLQDVPPVVLDTLPFANRPIIYVGDIYQRGAFDLGANPPPMLVGPTYSLDTSFVLGPSLANLATNLLRHSIRSGAALVGLGQRDTLIDPRDPTFGPLCIVCRSLAGAAEAALDTVGRLCVPDELEQMCRLLRGIDSLQHGMPALGSRLLTPFRSYREFGEYAQQSTDPDLIQAFALGERYRDRLQSMEASIRARAASAAEANFIVMSARGVRRKQLRNVQLGEDFPRFHPLRRLPQAESWQSYEREVSLLYVACIAARDRLFLNASAREMLATKPTGLKPDPC